MRTMTKQGLGAETELRVEVRKPFLSIKVPITLSAKFSFTEFELKEFYWELQEDESLKPSRVLNWLQNMTKKFFLNRQADLLGLEFLEL